MALKPIQPKRLAGTAVDPSLQLWVAATLYVTAIIRFEMVYGTLEPADAEAIYPEYGNFALICSSDSEPERAHLSRVHPLERGQMRRTGAD